MALEDRCSPSSASTPGPKASSDRPGSDGNAVRVTSPPTPSSVKDNDNRQTKFDEGYELKRKIKMEPDVDVDNYEEKKIRIWRKISDEDHDDSKSSNSDLEKRLSPGGYDKIVKTTSFSPEIIQRFSSYSIERFVNSDMGRCGGGENSSGNGIIQSNGQYPMDVNNGNYLNVPLFMSKTHKNVTMLNSSHQKVSRTPENGRLSSSDKKSQKRTDSIDEEPTETNNNNGSNINNNSNNNNNNNMINNNNCDGVISNNVIDKIKYRNDVIDNVLVNNDGRGCNNGYKLLSAEGMARLQDFLRQHGNECIKQFVQVKISK